MKLFSTISFKKILGIGFMILCFGVTSLSAQGWEIYFGGIDQAQNKDDYGESVLALADGGYILAGSSESFGDDNDIDVYVVRIDADGEIIWSNIYDEGWQERASKIRLTSEGNFIIAGSIRTNPGDNPNAYFLEIDPDGTLLWSNQYGGDDFDAVYDVVETDDGFVFVGELENNIAGEDANFLIIKTDETGNENWVRELGGAGSDIARSIILTDNGYAVFGQEEDSEGTKAYLVELDFNGDVIWEQTYAFAENNYGYDLVETQDGFLALTGFQANGGEGSQAFLIKVAANNGAIEWQRTIGGNLGDEAYELTETSEGDLVIVGTTEVSALDIDVLLSRYNSEGDEIWFRTIGRDDNVDFARGIQNTETGGFIVVGFNALDPLFAFHDVTLIRTDAEGNIFSNYVEGKVFFDESGDCSEDPNELGLTEWLVVAEGEQNTFYGSTDAEGNYSILLDTGIYDIRILPKNNYWDACIEVYNDVDLSNFYDTTSLSFPIHDVIQCPLLNVDVSTPMAQSCADITYTVSYCNDGTTTAFDPYIELELDEEFTFNSATQTVTTIDGNLLTFADLDNVAVGECVSFSISVAADCGSTPLSTYAVSAHIYPDDICTEVDPDWDMSSIAVNGECEEENIKFTISNTSGNDMTGVQEFVITEDQVMLSIVPFDLGGGEDTIVTLPATGATYRLIAEQSPGHPGNSYPTVAVEGCVIDGQGVSTGSVTIFQEDENDAFISIDVQQIDNETQLIGYPTGYPSNTGDSLLLASNTPIQYHLNFENTTTGIINRIVIRDTLDTEVLDIASLIEGVSSHPYSMEIYGGGIVKFVFENMTLLPEEQGFIQFKINQQADLVAGTRIANSADVYMGYEAPTRTNEVIYHIGGAELQDFVTIDLIDNTIETFVPDVNVSAFPNPFVEGLTVEMQGAEFNNLTLKMYNESGQLLLDKSFTGNQVHINRGGLPSGVLFFTIDRDNKKISTGKVLVQ